MTIDNHHLDNEPRYRFRTDSEIIFGIDFDDFD